VVLATGFQALESIWEEQAGSAIEETPQQKDEKRNLWQAMFA